MEVIIVKDYDAVSQKAFEVMKEVVTSKKAPVLGLATGSSPIRLYQNMIKDHKENGTSYVDVRTFNSDEWDVRDYTHARIVRSFLSGHSCMRICFPGSM